MLVEHKAMRLFASLILETELVTPYQLYFHQATFLGPEVAGGKSIGSAWAGFVQL